jgi:hypothetical protein
MGEAAQGKKVFWVLRAAEGVATLPLKEAYRPVARL